ncbi:unnamed protein product, partial [Ectocarpus sp. 4 AP-2014]
MYPTGTCDAGIAEDTRARGSAGASRHKTAFLFRSQAIRSVGRKHQISQLGGNISMIQKVRGWAARLLLSCARTELVLVLTLLTVASPTAWGWKECSISPQDEWKEATEDIPAMRMRAEYQRGYTCATSEDASFMAANYYFDSPCLAKRFFYPPDVRECLRGRVIFLGDSVSNQQGDSLVGMLGWHPEWMPRGAPRNQKLAVREDGTSYFTLVDCWHPPGGSISGIERCYDVYDTDFPFEGNHRSPKKPSLEGHVSTTDDEASASTEGKHDRRTKRRSFEGDDGGTEEVESLEGEGEEEEEEEKEKEDEEEDEEDDKEEEGGVEEVEEKGGEGET